MSKQDIIAGTHDSDDDTKKTRFLSQLYMTQASTKVVVIVGDKTESMSLLMVSAKSDTYYVDVDTLTGADKDGCVPYHFEINSGVSCMPADSSYLLSRLIQTVCYSC